MIRHLYMTNNCDVYVDISSNDGSISLHERQEDGAMYEFSLIEVSQRNE